MLVVGCLVNVRMSILEREGKGECMLERVVQGLLFLNFMMEKNKGGGEYCSF